MKTVKKIVSETCMISVAITVLFCLYVFFSKTLSEPAMSLTQYLIILLFSALLSLSNLLLSIAILPKAIRWILHYLACSVSFYAVFIGFSKISFSAPSVLFIFWVIFTVLYLLWMGACLLVGKFHAKKRSTPEDSGSEKSEESYTPRFR